MSEERIQFDLIERFAAHLPEFYQRRIIFWQDEDREFESMLDELSIPDVTVIKLTGTNNFAVKKLLLHDDLTGNYLIYNPFSYADPKDNWLLDIEKFSEEYRSDLISTRMNELNIEASPAMRKTVKLYAKFFDSKERIERLKRIGREYHTPLQLHIDIMAVLAGRKVLRPARPRRGAHADHGRAHPAFDHSGLGGPQPRRYRGAGGDEQPPEEVRHQLRPRVR